MMAKIASTLKACTRKLIFANFSQLFLSAISACLDAVKKDIAESNEAIHAMITNRCPSCPGNKCSPSKFIGKNYCAKTSWQKFVPAYFFQVLFCRLCICLGISTGCPYIQNDLFAFYLLIQCVHFFQCRWVCCCGR